MMSQELTIPTDTSVLSARLHVPASPSGLVVVAEGAFSLHRPPVDQWLTASRGDSGLAVVSVELSAGISSSLDADDRVRRDAVHILAQRLATVTRWLRGMRVTARLPMGYFACGLGAAAACAAAVMCGDTVRCLASWQGRIDLVGHDLLQRVCVPALLLVGDHDPQLITSTRSARAHLGGPHTTKVLRGDDVHEEAPVARATDYARAWLVRRLEASRDADRSSHAGGSA